MLPGITILNLLVQHAWTSRGSRLRRCFVMAAAVAFRDSTASLYGHRSESGRNMGLQFEEGARDTPALKRKGVRHVRGIQQLVVETARCRIGA